MRIKETSPMQKKLGKYALKTTATNLYEKDIAQLKNLCDEEGVTEAAALRYIVHDWLFLRRRKYFENDQMTARIRNVYREVVTKEVDPLREKLNQLLLLVKDMKVSLKEMQPSQDQAEAQGRDDNFTRELHQIVINISESQTETANQLAAHFKKLSSLSVRQLVTERMLAKLFSLEWVTQRFIIDYLVEERLRQEQVPPQEFPSVIDGFSDPLDKKGYEALAEIEDEYELPQELRLTNRPTS